MEIKAKLDSTLDESASSFLTVKTCVVDFKHGYTSTMHTEHPGRTK